MKSLFDDNQYSDDFQENSDTNQQNTQQQINDIHLMTDHNQGGAMVKSKNVFINNPILTKIGNKSAYNDDELADSASYAGIFFKFLLFTAMIIAGIVISSIVKNSLLNQVGGMETLLSFYIGLFVVTSIFTLISSFVCSGFSIATPIFACIDCALLGMTFSGLAFILEDMGYIIYIALILTVALVLSLMIVYSFGKIRLKSKFFKGLSAIISTYLMFSLVMLILSLIPQTRYITNALYSNFAFVVTGSVFGVILGCCFLISDFEIARSLVENKAEKITEWSVAYSVMFSIIWLYLKVLSLLIRLKRNSDK